MVAELAGAQAEAADGAMAKTEIAATAMAAVRAFRCIGAPRFVVTPVAGPYPKLGEGDPACRVSGGSGRAYTSRLARL